MGQLLVGAVKDAEGVTLWGAVDRGAQEGITSDLAAALRGAEVLIDFSSPAGAGLAAAAAAAAGVGLVVGTTGLGAEHEAAVRAAAERVPVVWSANMSLGVNLLLGLLRQASAALPGFDLEIVELHHGGKADAPSGTALAMARAAGRDMPVRSGRSGVVGVRPKGEVGVLAVRGGDVVGEHTAYLLGPGERLELTHRATNRQIFAHGAVRAARWVAGRGPGLYGMQDVLGLLP